ncbi:MAG: glycoside hydrolase family 88 protein, partial [Bacteroidales bacterium]|nr:glycoside hydrolase family 88 protein [Bacteroidales bacterium]
KIYPYQMWLDGLYMGEPFYAEYISRYGSPSEYEDVLHQFEVMHQHSYDKVTGLNYHAWDESKKMEWADKETGCSPEFWGRAMGWYAMALVDVLEIIPGKHFEYRNRLIPILKDVVAGIVKWQDPKEGVWFQVLNKGGQTGNYLEASASCMFTYALAKAVNNGYIDASYRDYAQKAYNGVIKNFIRENPDGNISLIKCCAVAGLGGNPYRSGTYDYYVNEKIRDNDPKGVGPFIMMCLEIQKMQPIAFPSAEGSGKYASGGRGGNVIKVTNLNDSGKGSLRWAAEQKGARTIIFDVSGRIQLRSVLHIKNGNLTIAGQTAPGDGICISGYPVKIVADNVIIRYMRFRLGDENAVEGDCLDVNNSKNVIIDHCSMSWSTDECGSFYGNKNFTLQYCILSESLNNSVHTKGEHGYGGIWGGDNASFHHNLLSCHTSRNPRITHPGLKRAKYRGITDFRNNVVYNWGHNSGYGGEEGETNIVANYYKFGAATNNKVKHRIFEISRSKTTGDYGLFFIDKNFVEGYPNISEKNLLGGVDSDTILADVVVNVEFPASPIRESSAEVAYANILRNAGASYKRDVVDERVIDEVQNNSAKAGKKHNGIIDSQNDVGGFPEYKSEKPLIDSDNDGIPDEYEQIFGTNPKKTDSHLFTLDKNYSNLEIYFNAIVSMRK